MTATTTRNSGQDGSHEPYNVLLIGNNPMTLGSIYKKLMGLKDKRLIIDFCFDCQKSIMRALRFRPNIIFLDDNINKKLIRKFIDRINRNKRTKDIPIALLKSSNYNEVVTSGVQDYLLKENITSERLYHTMRNAGKFKRTARLLKIASRRRKRQFNYLLRSVKRYFS
jgi:CheY-like chemotaxis protein